MKNSAVAGRTAEEFADSGNKRLLARDDRSLTVHVCHSPQREVEVLHDRLLAMLEADPTLTPRDIIVMVADIDSYSPFIQAVFGSATGETLSAVRYFGPSRPSGSPGDAGVYHSVVTP
ncbi:hypothetical protein ACLK1Y_15665 [Escherichia coli]